jgi:hypothetical protein
VVEFDLDVERWRIPVQSSGSSNSRGALEDVGRDLADLVSEGNAVLGCLRKVGRLVDYVGFLVRLTQAPGIVGALDVRWWRLGGGRAGVPVLVRWLQTRGGKARTKRVLRVRREVVDGVAVPEMRELLWELVGLYGELSEMWGRLSRVLRGGRLMRGYVARGGYVGKVERIAQRVVELHGEVERVLLDRGVRVEKRFRVEEVVA